MQVLQRLAPLKRGLYEDYVANFWCSTHFLLNWKRLLGQGDMLCVCMGGDFLSFYDQIASMLANEYLQHILAGCSFLLACSGLIIVAAGLHLAVLQSVTAVRNWSGVRRHDSHGLAAGLLAADQTSISEGV